MAYADLTPIQQQTLDDFMSLLRTTTGQAARFLRMIDILNLAYTTTGIGALTPLATTDPIPNKTNLAGAQDLLRSEVESLMSGFQSLLTAYGTDANKQLHARAAGVSVLL